MELFFLTLVIGMATAMFVGVVIELLESYVNPKFIRAVLTLPLALLASWLLGLVGNQLIVATFAAGFFSAALLTLLTKAATVTTVVNRR